MLIHKKDSKLKVTNYRHISLFSNIDNIFEKLILYFSTNHVILNLLEIIQKSLDDGQIACGTFIDLEKAFKILSPDILLEKLDHYGFRGNKNDLFRSYLSDRSQFVSIKTIFIKL